MLLQSAFIRTVMPEGAIASHSVSYPWETTTYHLHTASNDVSVHLPQAHHDQAFVYIGTVMLHRCCCYVMLREFAVQAVPV